MRKSKLLRQKQITAKKQVKDYVANHGQHMVTAILNLMIKAGLINTELEMIQDKEQVGLYLNTLYADVHTHANSGHGKHEFVSSILSIATHYDVVDLISEFELKEIPEEEIEFVEK